jgi:hypothetical protein
MLSLRLRSTSLWLVFRPSLKVCWLHLVPVRSAVFLAALAPCLHFKPLDLLSRDMMFAFVCAGEDFSFLIPVHPMRLHRRHVFASLRYDFVSTASPTRRSGLVRHGYPWVPTDQGLRGPCRVDPTCQKSCRPASGPGDLIHNPSDPGRPWTTLSRLQKTCRACGARFSLDHGGAAAIDPRIAGSPL